MSDGLDFDAMMHAVLCPMHGALSIFVMNRVLKAAAILTVVSALTVCKSSVEEPQQSPTPEQSTVATPLPKLELKREAELEAEIAKIAEEARGKVGVAAVVLETGEAAFLNADDRYPMQSVYKLPISMAVMEQVRLAKLNLNQEIGVVPDEFVRKGMASPLRDRNPNGGKFTIRELIRLALVESDGTASDVLMRVAGGASEIQNYLSQIGIIDMKVVNTEKEIGRDWETQYENWATPIESVELLRWLTNSAAELGPIEPPLDLPPGVACNCPGPVELHLKHNDLRFVVGMMKDSRPGARRLKGLIAENIDVAHKTGTGGTQNGITLATNDIGVIYLPNGKHLAIAVFVSDSPADEKTRELVIAKIAKVCWDRWNKN